MVGGFPLGQNFFSATRKATTLKRTPETSPGSKTTPVHVVFNSSQGLHGYSLNLSWDLGPDIMSNLFGVLLRFRKGSSRLTGRYLPNMQMLGSFPLAITLVKIKAT